MEPRVLVIDADPAARAAAVSVLAGAGINVVANAASGEEAMRLVALTAPNVVMVDVGLHGMSARDLVRRLREQSGHRLEVIATAAFAGAARLGELVGAGTSAYIVNGKSNDLVAAVRAVAAGSGLLSAEASRPVLEEVQRLYDRERARNEELEVMVTQLQALSVTDWLTGLKNHGYFFDRLTAEMERARRYDRPLAVLLGDLDDFKAVNDAYGHGAGDAVLKTIGEVLRNQVREVDIACRVGGEEFGLLMPETDVDGAVQVAERVRMAVGRHRMPGVGSVYISLGVAVFPFHAQDRNGLMEAADRALYQAKREGKNRVRVAGGTVVPSPTGRNRVSGGPFVGALLSALRMRSPSLADHSLRVSELATAIGMKLNLTVAEVERLRLAGLLHDVGMLAVPDRILLRKGPLSEEDWAVIRRHPQDGFELVAEAVHEDVARAVLTHHEAFDGTGYPARLRGVDIPLGGRVVLVADAYDAMLMDRPHRQALTQAETLDELRTNAGQQFDPEVVDACVRALGLGTSEAAPVIPLRRAAGG